eukprot:7080935-Pyramimonas_sp.AAC.1
MSRLCSQRLQARPFLLPSVPSHVCPAPLHCPSACPTILLSTSTMAVPLWTKRAKSPGPPCVNMT